MNRARSLFSWFDRVMSREDPTLRRFETLRGARTSEANPVVPVFFRRRTASV
jgi:hypothetical protein